MSPVWKMKYDGARRIHSAAATITSVARPTIAGSARRRSEWSAREAPSRAAMRLSRNVEPATNITVTASAVAIE